MKGGRVDMAAEEGLALQLGRQQRRRGGGGLLGAGAGQAAEEERGGGAGPPLAEARELESVAGDCLHTTGR